MTTERVKVITHLMPETDKKVEAFMKKAGMTKARVCALAIIAGIDTITTAITPNSKEKLEVPPTDNMGVEIENK